MYIHQLYTSCLAEASYYVESNGEAVVIDPIREPAPYLEMATERGAKITHVFETHFHADFISGHVDLAAATGATIVLGPGAKTGYPAHEGHDGEIFRLGGITLELLHTPGHTPESSTFLLRDETGNPHCIFTGDTLFIGDVGRPDLAISSSCTQEDLARQLYHSLRSKIMPLPDSTLVYPAHGAGSPCGKNISKETFDTLGNQRATNYALQDISADEFVALLTSNMPPAPAYFAQAAIRNRDGIQSLAAVLGTGLSRLSVSEIKQAIANGAILLDSRNKAAFVAEHIPGSIFIGLEGDFAPWAAKILRNLDRPLVFVSAPGKEEEVVTRLARVGFENCLGYLEGGIEKWKQSGNDTDSLPQVDVSAFQTALSTGNSEIEIAVLDVRQPGEFKAGHLRLAMNQPLSELTIDAECRTSNSTGNEQIGANTSVYIHCQGGYRSVIAASIMRHNGVQNVTDVAGGYLALTQSSCDIVTDEAVGCSA
jgi:hydroxyacylglutathione hydrolase